MGSGLMDCYRAGELRPNGLQARLAPGLTGYQPHKRPALWVASLMRDPKPSHRQVNSGPPAKPGYAAASGDPGSLFGPFRSRSQVISEPRPQKASPAARQIGGTAAST